MATHEGTDPTSEDEFWLNAATDLTPQKSLERIDAQGKYLFNTVAIVGTLLTGFNAFKASWPETKGAAVLLYPIMFAAISLALAMMGITPRLDRISRTDVFSVREHYNRLIRRRGRFVFWGSVSFAMSLASVPLALGATFSLRSLGPSLAAEFAGIGGKATLASRLVADVPQGGTAEIEVIGYQGTGKGHPHAVALGHQVVRSTSGEKTTLSAKVEKVDEYVSFLVRASIEVRGKILWRDEISLPRER